MLIIDDLFMAPFKGLFWVFRKIDQAAREELEGQKQRMISELSELYMQLDTGKISEQEFNAREKMLLDRLDQIKKQQGQQAGVPSGRAKRPPPAAGEQNRHEGGGEEARARQEAKPEAERGRDEEHK